MDARLQHALSGTYVIERELGTGGMATVWLAHDLKHDRQVAVKVIHPHLAALVGAERFLKEIKTTANLQHPHILPLFDSGDAEGLLFYVMPFVDGESLRQRITRAKQLPVADAVRITSEVASALDYAHRHGVIHRDIKPENILLHDGRALVADFGIALASSAGDSRLTEAGMSLGTPHYMSPEQALGERQLDARSDIYAVGAVLYEMLTGAPPFTGTSAQAIVAKVITEKPVPPSRLRKEIPAHVEDALLTALQKNPIDRFATAAALQSALAEAGGVRRGRRRAIAPRVLAPALILVVLAAAVMQLSRPKRTAPARARHEPTAEARTAVLQATALMKKRDSVSLDKAVEYFSAGFAADSSYAEAWAGTAQAMVLRAVFGFRPAAPEFMQAKANIEMALRLDPTSPHAHTTLAFIHVVYDQDYPAAASEFHKSVALDSTLPNTWLYRGWYYVGTNHLDSALTSMRRGQDLDPGDKIIATRVGTVLLLRREYAEAEQQLRRVLEQDSTWWSALVDRAMVHVLLGRCGDALNAVPSFRDRPGQVASGTAAYVLARCGHAAEARRYAASVEARPKLSVDAFYLAIVYAGLNDTAKVFEWLSYAVEHHGWSVFQLRSHPAFEPFRSDPRFGDLLRKARLM